MTVGLRVINSWIRTSFGSLPVRHRVDDNPPPSVMMPMVALVSWPSGPRARSRPRASSGYAAAAASVVLVDGRPAVAPYDVRDGARLPLPVVRTARAQAFPAMICSIPAISANPQRSEHPLPHKPTPIRGCRIPASRPHPERAAASAMASCCAMAANHARADQRAQGGGRSLDGHRVCALSRASRNTFTTLFKLGSGQVEQLQLKLSRAGRSSTRYSPLTQNSAPPSSMSIRSRPPGQRLRLDVAAPSRPGAHPVRGARRGRAIRRRRRRER